MFVVAYFKLKPEIEKVHFYSEGLELSQNIDDTLFCDIRKKRGNQVGIFSPPAS